jgi:hypothetical protein
MAPKEAKDYGIIDEVYAERDQSLISEAKKEGGLAGEGAAAHEGEDVGPETAKSSPEKSGRG